MKPFDDLYHDPPEDSVEELKRLRQLADQGDQEARLELVNRLIDGIGCEADPKEGMKQLCQLAEGRGYLAEKAQLNLAIRLIEGRGCPANPKPGMFLLRRLVEWGNVEAQKFLRQYEKNTP